MRKEEIKDYTVDEVNSLCIGYGADFHIRDLVEENGPYVDIIESDSDGQVEGEEIYLAYLHCKDGVIRVGIYSNNAWTVMDNANDYTTLVEWCSDWEDEDTTPDIIRLNANWTD